MAKKKTKRGNESKELTLIVPAGATSVPLRDKGGGELQSGAISRMLGFGKVEKSIDKIKAEMTKLSDTVSVIASAIQAKQSTGYEVKSIEIGVAISAEGDIGIATAGVEASISITLERK